MQTDPNPHVLVVDDDVAVGRVLRAQLLQAGYRASLAHSGREALAILETQLTDLVLSDLRMPEMDGLSLLAQLKQRWPEVAVVMLTAHGTVPSAVAAMRAGASDFLLKPFEREDVLATLQRVLAASAGTRAAPPRASQPLEPTEPLEPAEPLELSERVHATERATIVNALAKAGGNRTLAARLLGVSRRTLYNKLTEHGIS